MSHSNTDTIDASNGSSISTMNASTTSYSYVTMSPSPKDCSSLCIVGICLKKLQIASTCGESFGAIVAFCKTSHRALRSSYGRGMSWERVREHHVTRVHKLVSVLRSTWRAPSGNTLQTARCIFSQHRASSLIRSARSRALLLRSASLIRSCVQSSHATVLRSMRSVREVRREFPRVTILLQVAHARTHLSQLHCLHPPRLFLLLAN